VAIRRATIKLRVGPALYRVMKPGDQIVAGTSAMAGPAPWLDMIVAVPYVAFSFASIGANPNFAVYCVGAGGTWLWSMAMQFRRRPVFVAVTQRQLICYRLSRMASEPTRLMFCAPLAAVRMTSAGARAPRWRSIRYSGPGAESRGLRFNVLGRWRQDLDEVLTALRAGGAGVEGLPPSPRPWHVRRRA
jgi:hypothetical protein